MSKEWDDDPKTAVIETDDVTEQWNAKELLELRKKRSRENEAKAEKKETPGNGDVEQAIEDTLGRISLVSDDDVANVLQSSEMTTPRGSGIGEILLSTSQLTHEQLDEALALQEENDDTPESEKIGEILVRKNFITEDELIQALSLQLNVPIVRNLAKREIEADLVKAIPIHFAKRHGMVPLERSGDLVTIATANASDLAPIDDVRILMEADVKPVLAKQSEIVDVINRLYDRVTDDHEELMEDLEEQGIDSLELPEPQDLLESEDEAPIIRLVNTLLFRAVKERASDIHIEPFEKELSVRFRIDGVMYEIMKPPKRAQASISSRVKIMAQLDIAEKRIPQDGRIKIKIAGRDVDIRVSTLPTSFGERIVMRLLDTSNVILSLEDVGFSSKQLVSMEQVIHKSHGIFLVTGPTGSGKTTTLYACLSRINSRERNIITVEDPVEIQLSGIGQIQVNPKVDLTFASGLRSILRQDPDVIMVGEIRDLETAEIAIQASLTGHLVFSTLHTNDAASSITRLVDMGVEPFLVSNSLVAVMAQRLVRVACKICREQYSPTSAELEELGISEKQASSATIFRANGCNTCWNTGYLGRTGIYEILPVDDQIRALILKSADGTSLKKSATARGMKTLREDGIDKVLRGISTIEEVLRVTQEEMAFE